MRIRNRSGPCLLSFASFPLLLLHGEAPLRLLRLLKATVFLLLGLMMSGQISAADPALEIYSEKATRGDAQTQYRLGVLLSSGVGIARDRQKAVDLYGKATQQGHVDARYKLGKIFADGVVVPQDMQQAKELFTKVAQQGPEDAQNELGEDKQEETDEEGKNISDQVTTSWHNPRNDGGNDAPIDLNIWPGRYEYGEMADTLVFVYELRISQEGKDLLADLDIDGHLTCKRLRCDVREKGNALIEIFFKQYREDRECAPPGEPYGQDIPLLSLQRSGGKILTKWGQIESELLPTEKWEEYFKKTR